LFTVALNGAVVPMSTVALPGLIDIVAAETATGTLLEI
jgi:hypothetical protein